MDVVAVGFWGGYFGSVGLMLAGSLAAFARSQQRVALTAALSGLVSTLFVVAYLGWLPISDPAVEARLLAHVAVATSVILGLMLLAMLGLLRNPATARIARVSMVSGAALVLGAGWMMDPHAALAMGSIAAFTVGVAMLVTCVRSARRGDRLAWVAVSGVSFMLIAVSGLSWIALNRDTVPWPVHAVSAVAGMAYLSMMATALWNRYSYLIELREVVTHGASYDPITRMRTHAETGQMVGLAFFRQHDDASRAVGVIVVSIGNLYTLENLHGRTALNHALFVCASRLRRCVPGDVEMGRMGDDGFLLLVRGAAQAPRLIELGRLVANRLARPVVLSTSASPAGLEAGEAHWEAQVGVGVLAASPQVRPSAAVALARAMSRTAWSYASRIAWRDPETGRVAELPTD
ncbi:7TM diverse intracellular signaling domain-containing protein [Caenimonas aquaedulcis]|uniref:Diguanylate cyclase n=1 Tax=Caenimonas aquaedulcis TaxID=2793270 RepID=A0A931H1T5_9BURK|nr:7TM diverse intracellular signaling domain-containing protein [Caenimonas aquaedulcis]MBG9386997.1 diguanylate cyclase [Caenimonas aquaedulcis]